MLLPIVAWLAIYVIVLYLVGTCARPWRQRSSFKLLFLPGVVISVVIQKLAAVLCLSVRSRMAPIEPGRPAFSFDAKSVPVLAGALFFVLSHGLFYVVFAFAVSKLCSAGLVADDLVSLPSLHAQEMLEGNVEVDARGYVSGLGRLLDFSKTHALFTFATFWVAAGGFATLTFTGRQLRWSLIALGLLAVVAYFADWFGAGFPFLTRGWWARFFRFPGWWAVFSFYLTALLFSLALFATARGARAGLRAWRAERREEER